MPCTRTTSARSRRSASQLTASARCRTHTSLGTQLRNPSASCRATRPCRTPCRPCRTPRRQLQRLAWRRGPCIVTNRCRRPALEAGAGELGRILLGATATAPSPCTADRSEAEVARVRLAVRPHQEHVVELVLTYSGTRPRSTRTPSTTRSCRPVPPFRTGTTHVVRDAVAEVPLVEDRVRAVADTVAVHERRAAVAVVSALVDRHRRRRVHEVGVTVRRRTRRRRPS